MAVFLNYKSKGGLSKLERDNRNNLAIQINNDRLITKATAQNRLDTIAGLLPSPVYRNSADLLKDKEEQRLIAIKHLKLITSQPDALQIAGNLAKNNELNLYNQYANVFDKKIEGQLLTPQIFDSLWKEFKLLLKTNKSFYPFQVNEEIKERVVELNELVDNTISNPIIAQEIKDKIDDAANKRDLASLAPSLISELKEKLEKRGLDPVRAPVRTPARAPVEDTELIAELKEKLKERAVKALPKPSPKPYMSPKSKTVEAMLKQASPIAVTRAQKALGIIKPLLTSHNKFKKNKEKIASEAKSLIDFKENEDIDPTIKNKIDYLLSPLSYVKSAVDFDRIMKAPNTDELRVIIDELENKDRGNGFKLNYNFSRRTGRGIVLEEPTAIIVNKKPAKGSRYKPFGRFVIHVQKLEGGSLRIGYDPHHPTTSYKDIKIGNQLKDLLKSLANGEGINKDLYESLDSSDMSIFNSLLRYCKINNPHEKANVEVNRFNILKGELISGNNNIELLDELKNLTENLLKQKLIKKADGDIIITYINSILL